MAETEGYHSLSIRHSPTVWAGLRLTGLFTAKYRCLYYIFGADLSVSIFPRMVYPGGFLLYLAPQFLTEWLYDAWFKLPIGDYLLIWLILIAIASIGLLRRHRRFLFAVVLFVIT